MKKRVLALTMAAVGTLTAVSTASAAEWLYYVDGSSLGRVQSDGTQKNGSFATITGTVSGLAANGSDTFVIRGSQATAHIDRVSSTGGKTTITSTPLCASAANSANDLASAGLAANGNYLYYVCEDGPSHTLNRYLARISFDGATRNEGLVDLQNTTVNAFAVDAEYAYLAVSQGAQTIRVDRAALSPGSTRVQGPASSVTQLAIGASGFFWGNQSNIGRYAFDFPTLTSTSLFTTVGGGMSVQSLAAGSTAVFWRQGTGSNATIRKADPGAPGTSAAFLTGSSGGGGMPGPGSGLSWITIGSASEAPADTGSVTPTPTPTPTPTAGFAIAKATPTVNTNTPGENAVVTVSLQLEKKGKYTFIFENPTSNEMAREQATSSRVSMQKGSKIGKRLLKKRVTAAVITTTEDNAKLVTRALLRKAQAKKLNLRVIYAPTGTAQGESVIKIK